MVSFDLGNNMGEFAKDVPDGFRERIAAINVKKQVFTSGKQLSASETERVLNTAVSKIPQIAQFRDGWT